MRVGFVAVMTLIAALSVFSILMLRLAGGTLEKIVQTDLRAVELQFRMLHAARERSIVLYRIATSEDPFERDEQRLFFDALGGQFGEARRELIRLDLKGDIRTLLNRQGRQTAEGMAWQGKVLELALAEQRDEAIRLLVDKAIPAQDTVLATLNTMLANQIANNRREAGKLQWQLQAFSVWLVAATGTVALLLSLAGARYVRRRMDGLMGELSDSARNLEQAYRQLEYQKLAMDQHDIVSIADVRGNITYVNDKFCEISQYGRKDLIGRNHRLLKSAVHPPGFYEDMWATISGGRVWKGEVCNRKKDGSLYWVATTIVPFINTAGLPYQYVSVRTDITEIKEAQQLLMRGRDELEELVLERTAELAEREDVLRSITDVAHDAVIMLDCHSRVTFWSPAAEKIFGYAETEILDRNLHALLVSGQQLEAFQSGLAELQQSGAGALMGKTVELTALRNDGAEIFVEISLSAVRIKGSWHVVGIARDITARKFAEQQLELLATTDPLTGAANRRHFDEALHAETARSRRYGLPLSLVLFDIDYFKRINDSLGHPVGDRVLIRLVELVSANIRETDLFARLGGEEFAVLAPNCDADCARQFAEKLRRVVEAHTYAEVDRLTCSFGVAEYRNVDDEGALVKRADEALYCAKGEGRNRVVVAGPSV